MSDDAAAIRAGMAALARRKWSKLSPEQQSEHIRLMVAGRRKARKHRAAKARART